MSDTRCLDGHLSCAVIQQVLWVLILISLLLTLCAILSHSWQTMWAAAAFSLAFCLLAIWSIGALLFLLTCLQLAAALAWREEADLLSGALFLLAGAVLYLAIVYGLAILHVHELWLVAFPLAFLIGTLVIFQRSSFQRG